MRRNLYFSFVLCFGLILFTSSMVNASGYYIPEISARALGLGGAIVAQKGDAASIIANPAGLTGFKKHHFTINPSLSLPHEEWKPLFNFTDIYYPHEETALTDSTFIPHLSYNTNFGVDKFGFGFAFHRSYGFDTHYKDDGNQRYIVTDAYLESYQFTPGAAYEVFKNFSIGISGSVIVAESRLSRFKDLSELIEKPEDIDRNPVKDAKKNEREAIARSQLRLIGDDVAFTGQIGFLFTPHEKFSIGLTYIPETELEMEGRGYQLKPEGEDFNYTVIPTSQIFNGEEVRFTFPLPQIIKLGILYRPTSKVNLELDINYIGWDAFDVLEVVFDRTASDSRAWPQNFKMQRNWENSFAVRLGVEYIFQEKTTFRGGYVFDQTAIPKEWVDLILFDSNRHAVSFGAGLKFGDHFTLDWSYQHIWYETIKVVNTELDDNQFTPIGDESANGTYDNSEDIISFGLTYVM